jgi:hypothetical protein
VGLYDTAAALFFFVKTRDRHILKKDPKKWGTGDPLKLSNFFAKIVFLVLLYKTASKFFLNRQILGTFDPLKNVTFLLKHQKLAEKLS